MGIACQTLINQICPQISTIHNNNMQITLTEAMQIISEVNQSKWAVINSSLTGTAEI